MTPGWNEEVLAATDILLLTKLGPAIYADAVRACPVFGGANSTADANSLAVGSAEEPGALRDSIEFHVTPNHRLIVSASGSSQRQYAVYVELGHRIVAWGYDVGLSKDPQPFLRPALYTVRTVT